MVQGRVLSEVLAVGDPSQIYAALTGIRSSLSAAYSQFETHADTSFDTPFRNAIIIVL